jgi:hypothetical protein
MKNKMFSGCFTGALLIAKSALSKISIAMMSVCLFAACATSSGATQAESGRTAPPVKKVDNSASLLGTWTIDWYGDGDIVTIYTFNRDGTIHSRIFDKGVKVSDGTILYKATASQLTLRDATTERTMDYSVTSDGKGLSIKNFWGYGVDVIGVKE